MRSAVTSSLVTILAGCSGPPTALAPAPPAASEPAPAAGGELATLQRSIARFAPTDLTADLSALSPGDRTALKHLVQAAQVMDALFLEQVWAGNETRLYELLRDESDLGRARLHAFVLNKGPWSRLDHNEAFLPGVPAKPPSANFYPAGATQGRSGAVDCRAPGRRACPRDRLLHDHSPRPRRPAHRRALQRRIPGRAGDGRHASARGRQGHRRSDAQGLPRGPGRRVRLERLLRQRREVDGADLRD